MDVKLTLFVVVIVLGLLVDHSSADFFYNHPSPKVQALSSSKLSCIPGRTVIKIEEKTPDIQAVESNSEEFTRRHSNTDVEDRCKICICSAEGKDEFCSQRAIGSLNECMVLHKIMEQRENSDPFDITKTLAYRIRRDLIWHNDEIPYDPDSKCFRGHSYYTNHEHPNETDINYSEDTVSLLDFKSDTACYYCVCSVSGDGAQCISRSVYFCNYLRYLRSDNGTTPQRDMYASMFKQDRPAYFRQLSHRLRRTMDNSLFSLIEHGGDTLCCNHPDGHRRQLHNTVHNKLRTLKRRIPKENLLGGPMRGDYVDFVVNND